MPLPMPSEKRNGMSSPSASVQWPQRQSHGSRETSSAAKAPVTSKQHNISRKKLFFCSEGVSQPLFFTKCSNMKQHVKNSIKINSNEMRLILENTAVLQLFQSPNAAPFHPPWLCQANLTCGAGIFPHSRWVTPGVLCPGAIAEKLQRCFVNLSRMSVTSCHFHWSLEPKGPYDVMLPDLPASNGKLAITYQWGVSVGHDSASSNLIDCRESRILQQKDWATHSKA